MYNNPRPGEWQSRKWHCKSITTSSNDTSLSATNSKPPWLRISAPCKVMRRFKSSWSGAVRTLGAIGSHISRPRVSTCPAESVNEEVCCARTISRVSINVCWTFSLGRQFWCGRLWRPALKSFPGSAITCKQHSCKLCSSLAVRLVHLKHSRWCAMNTRSWRNELARQHSLR